MIGVDANISPHRNVCPHLCTYRIGTQEPRLGSAKKRGEATGQSREGREAQSTGAGARGPRQGVPRVTVKVEQNSES